MKIEPGMLCYVVRTIDRPEWVGRIVAAVRHLPDYWDRYSGYSGPAWVVSASWYSSRLWFPPSCLRPIHDPDADLTETQDMQDNLLAVLPYTRAVEPA